MSGSGPGNVSGSHKGARERDLAAVARDIVALFRDDADSMYVRASAGVRAAVTEAEIHRLAAAYQADHAD